MLWQLHILKDLSDSTQSLLTDLLNRIILKVKTNWNKSKNGNIVSNKVKKVTIDVKKTIFDLCTDITDSFVAVIEVRL